MTRARYRMDRLATYGFFIFMGIGTTAWLSRLPSVKETLGLKPSALALMTILGGCGALVAMLFSGVLTSWLGVRKSMLLAVSTWCLGMLIASYAVHVGSVPGVVAGLFFNSAGISLWGTVNTVEAGAVERTSDKSVMSRFHASYSLGMFLALALGSFLSSRGVSVPVHIAFNALATLLLIVACIMICPTRPLGDVTTGEAGEAGPKTAAAGADGQAPVETPSAFRKQLSAWVEPFVLMLALIDIALEASEGAVSDWASIGLVESFKVPEHMANLAPAIFAAAMIVSRFIGPAVIDRLGHAVGLYLTLLVSALGIAVYSLSPNLAGSLVGTALWGVGAALGVPIVTTLATVDPSMAAQRASVISTAYYGVSWIIPPAIGFLGDHMGVRASLLLLSVILVLVTALVGPVTRVKTLAGGHGRP